MPASVPWGLGGDLVDEHAAAAQHDRQVVAAPGGTINVGP
jgi:hypothetical protein